ncbi:MAG TPA: hypothetical protein QF716_01020 [Candidatus Thalassarchaeaceae archaeon]|nr:hypothetical protein [Candidatus Thalassarchaeaceae archaeon]HJM67441.1 hypothetical protein [Candidatus Thalassarchaeaceae archaeon]
MKKALAQNPNMLRTMIGLGLTLIVILSYAVYGATIDSSYYLYHTSNEQVEHTAIDHGLSNDNSSQSWTFSTNRSTTWLNISIAGVGQGDVVSVGVSDGVWYHHEMLGDEEADRFSCRQTNDGGFEEYNVCTESQVHSITAEESGNITIRGIVSPELPMGGLGSLYADSLADAEIASENLITSQNGTRVWTITLDSLDSIHPDEFSPHIQSTSHELESVEPFKVDTMTEMMWSITALIGCFGIALVVPLSIYFAARARERREEMIRNVALDKTTDES